MPDEQFSRLLSLLSHELRSPLGVTRGYLRLLEPGNSNLTENQLQAVAAALKASDRMAAILDQASTLAQLMRGQMTVTLAPVDVRVILGNAVASTALPIEPQIVIAPLDLKRVEVLADEPLLVFMYKALLNALARGQPADTTITIACRLAQQNERDGVAVELSTPIPASATRRDLDLSRGGVGLDLALVARIIAAHRGTIHELRDDHRLAAFATWLARS